MTSTIFMCGVLALCAAVVLLFPWLSKVTHASGLSEQGELLELNSEKERELQTLRELELDYATGKISLEDYNTSRQESTASLQKIYSKIDLKQHRV